MNKIRVEQLSKQYEQHKVLNDISFAIPSGKITVILGKNGAGKTTLIKILLNMIQGDLGEVYYDNQNIKQLGQRLYYSVSAILETVDNVYIFMTGKQNIEYFLGISQLKKRYQDEDIQQLIQELEMEHAMDKPVGSYSRGMKQKLALIIALMTDADIHFFDEPTLGLDFKSTKTLCTKIKDLSIKQGKTIILTSHQVDVIQELADYVIVLDHGQIIFSDTYANFLSYNQPIVTYYAVLNVAPAKIVVSEGIRIEFEQDAVRLVAVDRQKLVAYLTAHQLWGQVMHLSSSATQQPIEKVLELLYT